MQSARLAFTRSAAQTGTVEWSIEQRTQESLGRYAAVGIGHDAPCLRQVWANRTCESQNQRKRDERFKQRKSRLPVAPVFMARSRRCHCTS